MTADLAPVTAVAAVATHVLVLWAASALAVRALLSPVRFVGVLPGLGWQGYIPSRAATLAPALVDRILATVVTIPDLYRMFDPARIAEHLTESTQPRVGPLVEHMMLDQDSTLWDQVPAPTRRALTSEIQSRLPQVVHGFVSDLGEQFEDLLDVDHLVEHFLVDDPAPLSRLVAEVGRREFTTLVRSTLRLGPAGAIALVLAWWLLGPGWWLVPVGAASGAATIGTALGVLFWPRHPRRVAGLRLHGTFFRHQQESAIVATRMVLREVATVHNLAVTLFEGRAGVATRELARRHVRPLVRESLAAVDEVVRHMVPDDDWDHLVDALVEGTIDIARRQFEAPAFNLERQVAAERQLVGRVQSLTPEEFEAVIRPVLGAGESLLVALGGLAGAAAGTFVWLVA